MGGSIGITLSTRYTLVALSRASVSRAVFTLTYSETSAMCTKSRYPLPSIFSIDIASSRSLASSPSIVMVLSVRKSRRPAATARKISSPVGWIGNFSASADTASGKAGERPYCFDIWKESQHRFFPDLRELPEFGLHRIRPLRWDSGSRKQPSYRMERRSGCANGPVSFRIGWSCIRRPVRRHRQIRLPELNTPTQRLTIPSGPRGRLSETGGTGSDRVLSKAPFGAPVLAGGVLRSGGAVHYSGFAGIHICGKEIGFRFMYVFGLFFCHDRLPHTAPYSLAGVL